jgi:hypothetical protein
LCLIVMCKNKIYNWQNYYCGRTEFKGLGGIYLKGANGQYKFTLTAIAKLPPITKPPTTSLQ